MYIIHIGMFAYVPDLLQIALTYRYGGIVSRGDDSETLDGELSKGILGTLKMLLLMSTSFAGKFIDVTKLWT